MNSRRGERRRSAGQATLSFILVVSGILIEVAIAGAFITYLLSSSSRGEALAARAFTAADAGIRDFQVQLSRNKEFGGGAPAAYLLAVGNDAASVAVSRETFGETYRYRATSTGSAGSRVQTLVATFAVDQKTGLVNLESFSTPPL